MATKQRKADEGVQLKLRITEDLRQRLETSATAQHRSINGQIIHLLERALAAEAESLTSSAVAKRYRQYATLCLQRADASADPNNKLTMLKSADTWLKLAAQREKNIEDAPTWDDLSFLHPTDAPPSRKEIEAQLKALAETRREADRRPSFPPLQKEPELPMPRRRGSAK